MNSIVERDLQRMTGAISEILIESEPTIYLYGSVPMDDFHPGWSDIDLLVLTVAPITQEQAERLLMLRQELPKHYPDMQYARAFEGGMLPLDAFMKGTPSTVVYWGTSGQRITEQHCLDVFSQWELHHTGQLLVGHDLRRIIPIPTFSMLCAGVAQHLQVIRQHGRGAASLYAFGWLLDIARGIYTLRTGEVIAKTAAGEWALTRNLCPDEAALHLALSVRRDPILIRQPAIQEQALQLTPAIQGFADVLQQELQHLDVSIPT